MDAAVPAARRTASLVTIRIVVLGRGGPPGASLDLTTAGRPSTSAAAQRPAAYGRRGPAALSDSVHR